MNRPLLHVVSLLATIPVAGVTVAETKEPVCAEARAKSTLAETRCVIEVLKALDVKLETALADVAKQAAAEPGESFLPLWRENLTGFYNTSTDPGRQAEQFRRERRAVCAYAKSVRFQGTGYGIHTTRCELALTQTLLDQIGKPAEGPR